MPSTDVLPPPGDTSPVAGRILECLARYRFLTVPQFRQAGAGDEKTIRTRLRDLLTAKLIDRQEFRLGPSAGLLHTMYWLTAKGAERATPPGGEPPDFPKSPHLTASHAWHRRLTIDTLIAADSWAAATGQELPDVRAYMVRSGKAWASTLPALKVTVDAIVQVRGNDGRRRTYVTEIYCSRYSGGASSFSANQLKVYGEAGQSDALDEALGLEPQEPAARLLIVCDTPELRDRLLRTLPGRQGLPPAEARVWERFHFKAADELADFGNGWHRMDGGQAALPSGAA
ncbi:hypothetical protein OSH11_24470 [Kaistia dalseonensis]|uniref:Transcriptional regulator n=1 Tax=Kaistia dalseonensis TaxID=410840 RepID=A0ABU0HG93_9HYPH|nr:hypothetical protein [Kaistia dalseonensis]MCX5497875.1 hypothetical protein [Kaistia dalseonensis]MDQ0440519.1 hypothetical protein [Kaistia dalseonensis]